MSVKWYEKSGDLGDIVVSTRIRLARNLEQYPFPSRLNAEQRKVINSLFEDAMKKGNSTIANDFDFISLEELNPFEARSMAERHLISPEFAARPEGHGVILNKDNSIALMLCEEDHLRLQVLSPGLALNEAYELAEKIESLLSETLNFAFSQRYGYLTECPTNLGTGLRASVMLHLPALEQVGGIQSLSKTLSKVGFTLRGTYGENSGALGALYQLSNQLSLGIDEYTALDNLKGITHQVIEQEKAAREKLDEMAIWDKVFRSYGILKNARILSSKEFFEHISNIRLGISMGIISDISIETVNVLSNDMQAATLISRYDEAKDSANRDILRAKLVRESLK
ncbi:MAG: protein arginine kinase [Clostridia bacterium]|nr:protein arginine kinase [Clostridia bacterium]